MHPILWVCGFFALVVVGMTPPVSAQANACEAALPVDATSGDYLQRAEACFAVVGRLARIEPEVALRLALNSANEALGLDPTNAAAYALRGRVRLGTGAPGQAIADFTLALHLAPDATDYYLGRALAMVVVGDDMGALADYDTAVRLSPEAPDALFYRGLFYYQRDDWEMALANFEPILSLDPNHADAYEYIGHSYYALGEMDEALAAYSHYLDVATTRSALVNARVLLLQEAAEED